MLIDEPEGGIASEAEAPFTLRLSEPTLHSFTPDVVEDAQRYTYTADTTGTAFQLVLSGEAYRYYQLFPENLGTVAGQMAAAWDENAGVPGVTDIVPTQDFTNLGRQFDIVEVSVDSTSGKSNMVVTLTDSQVRPDVFAKIIGNAVAGMDAQEKAS